MWGSQLSTNRRASPGVSSLGTIRWGVGASSTRGAYDASATWAAAASPSSNPSASSPFIGEVIRRRTSCLNAISAVHLKIYFFVVMRQINSFSDSLDTWKRRRHSGQGFRSRAGGDGCCRWCVGLDDARVAKGYGEIVRCGVVRQRGIRAADGSERVGAQCRRRNRKVSCSPPLLRATLTVSFGQLIWMVANIYMVLLDKFSVMNTRKI